MAAAIAGERAISISNNSMKAAAAMALYINEKA